MLPGAGATPGWPRGAGLAPLAVGLGRSAVGLSCVLQGVEQHPRALPIRCQQHLTPVTQPKRPQPLPNVPWGKISPWLGIPRLDVGGPLRTRVEGTPGPTGWGQGGVDLGGVRDDAIRGQALTAPCRPASGARPARRAPGRTPRCRGRTARGGACAGSPRAPRSAGWRGL